MNTANFIQNFSSDNLSLVVTRFFDEIMVLYNLVGHRQDLNIYADNDSPVATFTIVMDSEEDADALFNSLNGSSFSVYNNDYNIDMTLSGVKVITTIKAAS